MPANKRNNAPKNNIEGNTKIPTKNKIQPIFFKLKGIVIYIFFTLPAGFEPAAHCLEGSCSIQLS